MNQLSIAARLLALGFSLTLSAAALAGQYAYTVIDVPGASETVANDINDVGHIVGSFTDSAGAHGFVYDGANFQVVDVPGASLTYAWGINDAGDVVGTFDDTAGRHGFLRAGSTFTTIDHPGATGTGAWGINNVGQIVGGYYFVSGADDQGYLKAGSAFNTIAVPGFSFSEAVGINNAGDVVGSASVSFAPGAPQHGFVMTGAVVTAFDVAGAAITNADGINDARHIVGVYADPVSGISQGFLKIGDTLSDIDVPGATSETGAFGINNRDFIVGSFSDAAGYHGFLATPVPEPATAALLIAGLAVLLVAGRWARLLGRTACVGKRQWRGLAQLCRDQGAAALFFALLLGSALPTAAAPRGAYVEAILPSKPFKFAVVARQNLFQDVLVAGDGAFGVTSITVTNTENYAKTLSVSEPGRFVGHDCGAPISTASNDLVVAVPALSTVHLAFPSPLVFSATNGHTCFRIYIYENSSMNVLLNGFSN